MIVIMCNALSDLFASGRVVSFQSNQSVFQIGDRVQNMYFVIDGGVDLVRYSKRGAPLILARVGQGGVLAEASAYSSRYHCHAVTSAPTQLRLLPVSAFRDRLHGSADIARTWAAKLAQELQTARMQSEIRSLKTVAERLDAWLGENKTLPPKGQMQNLAYFLGVSREALYRELARRRG